MAAPLIFKPSSNATTSTRLRAHTPIFTTSHSTPTWPLPPLLSLTIRHFSLTFLRLPAPLLVTSSATRCRPRRECGDQPKKMRIVTQMAILNHTAQSSAVLPHRLPQRLTKPNNAISFITRRPRDLSGCLFLTSRSAGRKEMSICPILYSMRA
jgi:hypothetical protein